MDMAYPSEAINVYLFMESVLFHNKDATNNIGGTILQTLNAILTAATENIYSVFNIITI